MYQSRQKTEYRSLIKDDEDHDIATELFEVIKTGDEAEIKIGYKTFTAEQVCDLTAALIDAIQRHDLDGMTPKREACKDRVESLT